MMGEPMIMKNGSENSVPRQTQHLTRKAKIISRAISRRIQAIHISPGTQAARREKRKAKHSLFSKKQPFAGHGLFAQGMIRLASDTYSD
jgi:hypothetical protein